MNEKQLIESWLNRGHKHYRKAREMIKTNEAWYSIEKEMALGEKCFLHANQLVNIKEEND